MHKADTSGSSVLLCSVLSSHLVLSVPDLEFFSVVARSPTLLAAARSLGVTAPAVSQRLREIESKLKSRLVDRSTRHLNLTGEGRLLAERGSSVVAEIQRITDAIASRQSVVSGHLRVAASFGFGRRFVAPIAAQFRREHPSATVELILSDNPSRLGADSWDLMVHIGPLKDSQLIATRLAANRRIVCAAPEYICRRGVPSSPADLCHHDVIALLENDEDVTLWRFTKPGSKSLATRVQPVMRSNSGEIVHDWALAGLGIIVRSEWDVLEDLRCNRLIQVLGDWTLPQADITALLSGRSQSNARTKKFLNLLKTSLVPPPWKSTARTPAEMKPPM
jgi:DNA-binding transcriptional LysR family regulator